MPTFIKFKDIHNCEYIIPISSLHMCKYVDHENMNSWTPPFSISDNQNIYTVDLSEYIRVKKLISGYML